MGDVLKDKVAVVTGSGQGIGKAVAIAMAKEGARLVTNNRQPRTSGGDAETTSQEIIAMGGEAIPIFGDISEFSIAQQLVKTTLDKFGKIDILVNNAAIVSPGLFRNLKEDAWDSVIRVNLKGTFCCCKAACVQMLRQKSGRIINISSRAVMGLWQGLTAYSASKGGVLGLTWNMAEELGRHGITVNAIFPRADTKMTEALNSVRQEIKADFAEANVSPRPRPPTPIGERRVDYVAPIVVYLARDEASNINGQVFFSGGGEIQLYPKLTPTKTIFKDVSALGNWSQEELAVVIPSFFGSTSPVR